MAADERYVVAQREQLALDRVDQRGVVAVGEIGPADRAREEHIAAEADRLGPRQEAGHPAALHSCQGRAAQTLPYLSWRAEAQQDAARRAKEV